MEIYQCEDCCFFMMDNKCDVSGEHRDSYDPCCEYFEPYEDADGD